MLDVHYFLKIRCTDTGGFQHLDQEKHGGRINVVMRTGTHYCGFGQLLNEGEGCQHVYSFPEHNMCDDDQEDDSSPPPVIRYSKYYRLVGMRVVCLFTIMRKWCAHNGSWHSGMQIISSLAIPGVKEMQIFDS
jgi:hypothetical protein